MIVWERQRQRPWEVTTGRSGRTKCGISLPPESTSYTSGEKAEKAVGSGEPGPELLPGAASRPCPLLAHTGVSL